ncbi:hypothetical protein MTR67_052390 [Solanum verrucosum]|uniref:Uncharacterized protein n=1 Tax=Solanum verrucosum TaxID=315347 RepID=A0AAF0V5N5_SOLVR|nr:hypothetical protein MTR67_052390 [Solanum verrucosum]
MSHVVRVSYVSQDEGSFGDQKWFSSAGHVEGVDSGRDTITQEECCDKTYDILGELTKKM